MTRVGIQLSVPASRWGGSQCALCSRTLCILSLLPDPTLCVTIIDSHISGSALEKPPGYIADHFSFSSFLLLFSYVFVFVMESHFVVKPASDM